MLRHVGGPAKKSAVAGARWGIAIQRSD